MSLKTIAVETDADGAFTYERRMAGIVAAIAVELGTLTTPDIDISDGVWDTVILSVDGVAADTIYQPVVAANGTNGVTVADTYRPPPVFGSLKVEVTGGGANEAGTIRLLFE